MKTEKIYTQHKENTVWMNDLSFYYDEIKIMKGRLAEIASKNSSKDVLTQVEHFQNQLLINEGQMDYLKHAINLSNDAINGEVLKNGIAIDHRKIEDHTAIRENINSFEKGFKTLRTEFNEFASKWM